MDPAHAGAANANVYLASSGVIEQIAGDASEVWTDLLTTATGIQTESVLRHHVRSVMTEHGCLPSQVIDRLAQNRIRPGD